MVDDHDALAQVLHDVLRQLRQIGQVDLLAPHRGFGVPQAARHRPGEQGHQEHDAAEDAGGAEVGGHGGMGDHGANLLQQQGQGGQGRQHEGVATVGEQGHGTHRNHEQDAQAAGHAATREHEQADGHRVHQHVHECGCTQIGHQAPASDDDGDARGEIDDAGPEEQFRPTVPERTLRRRRRRTGRKALAESAADRDSPGR